MNRKLLVSGVWSATVFFALWAIGYGVFARWVPPLSPMLTAQEVADIYRADSVSILIGMAFMTIGSVFYLPWTVVLSHLIKAIESRSSFLSQTQMLAGVMSTLTFFVPSYLWAAAAFRPARRAGIPALGILPADLAYPVLCSSFSRPAHEVRPLRLEWPVCLVDTADAVHGLVHRDDHAVPKSCLAWRLRSRGMIQHSLQPKQMNINWGG